MSLRKVLAPLVALACFAMAAQSTSAAQQTFAATTAVGANISTAYVYTTGPAGGLTIAPASKFLASSTGFVPDPLATLAFTGLLNTGTVIVGPTDVQNLTGGTFIVTAGDGITTLLAGTFTGAQLTTAPPLPESQANFLTTVLGVTYTGGTYFAASGLINPGGFSFGLTSANPTITLVGPVGTQYFTSFAAGGTGTYSAAQPGGTQVPLPQGAALGLTALPLLAVGFWMRRKHLASI